MKKILIVDDEEDFLFSVKNGLEYITDEYKIQTANNGEKCLNILNKETPDLILLDLMMPNMNGWQVLDTIRGNLKWRDIPIFLITATENPEFKKTAEELGITYIEKPFTNYWLKEKIDNFFNKQ
jgi:putative two-component system response regulator